jgi:hypothetical protein
MLSWACGQVSTVAVVVGTVTKNAKELTFYVCVPKIAAQLSNRLASMHIKALDSWNSVTAQDRHQCSHSRS